MPQNNSPSFLSTLGSGFRDVASGIGGEVGKTLYNAGYPAGWLAAKMGVAPLETSPEMKDKWFGEHNAGEKLGGLAADVGEMALPGYTGEAAASGIGKIGINGIGSGILAKMQGDTDRGVGISALLGSLGPIAEEFQGKKVEDMIAARRQAMQEMIPKEESRNYRYRSGDFQKTDPWTVMDQPRYRNTFTRFPSSQEINSASDKVANAGLVAGSPKYGLPLIPQLRKKDDDRSVKSIFPNLNLEEIFSGIAK